GDTAPDQARAAILADGGLVVSYIPDNTFLVRVPAGRSDAFTPGGPTASVFDYQPAYKLAPELSLDSLEPVTASLLAFPDGDLDAVGFVARAAGAEVLVTSDNGINKILRLRAPGAAFVALAQHEDVAWIEPYVAPELHNDQAQWVVQTGINGNRRVWDMGLHGEGQVVCTTDSGIDMGHHLFVDPLVPVADFGHYPTHRKVIAYLLGSDSPAVTFGDSYVFHGTHTAGTVAGTDDNAGGASPFDGVAKAAKLFFMDLTGPSMLNGVAPFADLNDLWQPSYDGNAGGAARISSNSWGGATNGAYTLMSLNADQFMWNHPDYLLFISNGNAGPPGRVGAPASAKSCVGAGGTQNGTSQGNIYNSTSRGPTDDGRRKPTICSPGQNVTSASAGQAYAPLSGTSMASPTMTGAATLIRQYCTEGWYPTGAKVPANAFTPSAALLKAMCVNSADNALPAFTAPDNNVGWGRINADNVCYFAGDQRRLLLVDNTAGLGQGHTIEYQVNVVDAAQPFEVTLCWTDAPPDMAAAIKLVNNLDLTVTNGVTTYKGNVYAGGFSATGGNYDDRNVEETVLIAAPAPGLWTVRIEAITVPIGPQPFGLCITGGVGSGAGTLALDRGSYSAASTVQIQVVDTNAGASVAVSLSSSSDPLGETVTLPGANGLYGASLALSSAAGPPNDGVLQVAHGDVISATYVDASPGASMTVTAAVSFTTPVITNVRAQNSGFQAAIVQWSTDINSSSKVYYGSTPALGGETTVDPTAATAHQVLVQGLALGQTYYYDVESVDISGNVTRDDNGGEHYRFTVNPPGDLLIIYGGEQFDREDRYAAALDALGWQYDVWKGSLSETPALGDLSSGLRAYRAVWWQPGLEYYPGFSDAARPVITSYLDGGGRLAVTGHDIVWGMADPTSPYFTVDRRMFVQNTLRTVFNADPAAWTGIAGIAGDPISG
ncbi:MAG TPA: S8 family serine peptidase, partial [Nocardioides sp.]|nr:S8 family serine peptidase [Nocardioides sp.]